MNVIDRHAPLGQLWRIAPEQRRVFENLGIVPDNDEPLSLTQACQDNGLDVEAVARMLVAFQGVVVRPPAVTVELMTLADLCDHIENVHHADLRDGLVNLDQLTRMVVEHQAAHDPRTLKIRQVFVGFHQKILAHLRVEAEVLFPLLRQLESNSGENSAALAPVKISMKRMEWEHYEIEEEFAHLCALTQIETPLAASTDPVRILHDAVVGLERGINEQIYKENQILFPRSRAISRGCRL